MALQFGRAQLGPAATTLEDEELLSDAVSLLAYGDPEASPCGALLLVRASCGRSCGTPVSCAHHAHLMARFAFPLLQASARAALGERLNGTLLAARGRPAEPALERAYRQAGAALEELRRGHEARALVLDVQAMAMGDARTGE